MTALSVGFWALLASPAAQAPVPKGQAAEDPDLRPWRVGAFIDTGYAFADNRPQNHIYRGHTPTPRINEFTVNLVGAYLRREVTRRIPWFFEVGLHAGPVANALVAAEPTSETDGRSLSGPGVWRHLAVANTGVVVPRSKTSLGAGLFVSPLGIGTAWTKDNWNVSVSWQSNAAPFYLLGARLLQNLGPMVRLEGWLVNGWQTMADGNGVPSGLVGVVVTPVDGFLWAHYLYFGPETKDTALDAWRIHADTYVTYDRPRFGIAAVWDAGQDGSSAAPTFWTGGALFARMRLAAAGPMQWDVAVRPEVWWDRDGAMFGIRQWLTSATATTSIRLYDALLVRVEYRYDRSTAERGFFYQRDALRDGEALASAQHTLFFNVVADYEFSFGRVLEGSRP